MPIDDLVFADLVRETSSTKGSDPFALQGPMAGYRAFGESVTTGDKFHYSAFNLSRPEESEVGVGTLLADGTIDRAPFDQATDFSPGTKAVALVAGSPWHDAVTKGLCTTVTPQQYGAKADGVTDDSAAIQAAIDSLRGTGGTVFFPKGTYLIGASVSLFLAAENANATKGIHLVGDGLNATFLRWGGGAEAMLSNAMPTHQTAHFQYGFSVRDMTLKGATSTGAIVAGAVGLHVEKLQNHWALERVRFEYFETGLEVGIHAEGGRFDGCTFAYCHVGADAFGIQADGLVWDKCWFIYNRDRGLRCAAPRPTVQSCMFVALPGYSADYAAIQLGKAQILAGDVGKSAYVGVSTTVTARPDAARIVGNFFEQDGAGNRAAILLDHVSSGDTATPERLTIEGNRFALYETPCGVEVADSWASLTTRDNSLTADVGLQTPLYAFDAALTDFGMVAHDEPMIARLADSEDSRLKFMATAADFEDADMLAAIPGDPQGWYFQHISGGYTTINADHDGRNSVKVELDCGSGQTTTAYWRIRKDSVPAGPALISFDLGGNDGLPNEPVYVTLTYANNGTKIVRRNFLPVGDGKQRIVFGAILPAAGVYVIDIAFHGAREMVGSYEVSNLRIKSGNPTNWQLESADGQRRLVNRAGQPFEMTGREPHIDYTDHGDGSSGWTYGPIVRAQASANAGNGATTIALDTAAGVSVGDYLFAKPNIVANVSQPHRATSMTGNRVTGISGTTVTLATGLSFDVDAGNSLIFQKVFESPARSAL